MRIRSTPPFRRAIGIGELGLASAARTSTKNPYTVHRLRPWFPALGVTRGRHVFVWDPGSMLTLAHELELAEHLIWFWVS